jgi:Putative heavy-metal-binding
MVQTRGGGTWGSLLAAGEFTAVRGAGFESVGQVFGACVYNIGYTGAFGCAGGWSGSDTGPVRALTRVSGEGGFGVRPLVEAMYEARRKAIDRMTAECAVLGGHGVVGVSLTSGEFLSGGLEFQAMGTAVRGAGAPAPPHPFSSDLPGTMTSRRTARPPEAPGTPR